MPTKFPVDDTDHVTEARELKFASIVFVFCENEICK